MTTIEAFTVPIFLFNKKNLDIDIDTLEHQKKFDLHLDNRYKNFLFFVEECMISSLQKMGFVDDYKIQFTSMWSNIMNPHHHTNEMLPHTHDNNFFSCVYYLTNENSPIVFYRPWSSHITPSIKEQTQYNSSSYFIKPDKGDLIIFPSYLQHNALLNISNSYRISLAINAILKGELGNHPGTKVKI